MQKLFNSQAIEPSFASTMRTQSLISGKDDRTVDSPYLLRTRFLLFTVTGLYDVGSQPYLSHLRNITLQVYSYVASM